MIILQWYKPAPAVVLQWLVPAQSVIPPIPVAEIAVLPVVIVPPAGGGGGGPPFVHSQSVPAVEWIINHNLGFRPAVTLFTVGGVEMEGEVIHSTLNQFRALFNTPLTGTAQGQ